MSISNPKHNPNPTLNPTLNPTSTPNPISTSNPNNLEIFDALKKINEKIVDQTPPSNYDKEVLQYRLNEQLTSDEHLLIFIKILQNMKNKIYTVTENSVLFDLNNLSNDDFWKMYYHTEMFINDRERQNKLQYLKHENDSLDHQFKYKINSNLQKILFNDHQKISPENQQKLSKYDNLCLNVFQECQYSKYAMKPQFQFKRNIYADSYQQRQLENLINSDPHKMIEPSETTEVTETNETTETSDTVLPSELTDQTNQISDLDSILELSHDNVNLGIKEQQNKNVLNTIHHQIQTQNQSIKTTKPKIKINLKK